MGCSSSRVTSDTRPDRTKRILSSLLCGAYTSQSHTEKEEYPDQFPVMCTEILSSRRDDLHSSRSESSSILISESMLTEPRNEVGASSESSTTSLEDKFAEQNLRKNDGSNRSNCLLERKESDPYLSMHNAAAATSSEERPSQESPYANLWTGLDAASEAGNSTNDAVSLICPEDVNSSSMAQEVLSTSASRPLSFLFTSLSSFQLFGDGSSEMEIHPSSGFMSDGDQDLRTGSVLQLGMVSISSNVLSSSIAEISNREARRNSRRVFWDALSRRSLRRHNDFPNIVFTTGHADDLESHDRWLLDLSGDLHYDGIGHHSEYVAARRHQRSERWWQMRSEISDRNRSRQDEGDQQTILCPSGRHLNGTCSCDSLFEAEEPRSLARMPQIVVLAEALFEVLDGIPHQPWSFSYPAPESVVNSFPLKNHKKSHAIEIEPNDVEQCYICLSDYEEGDQIRVLPCHHEYHMSCVDKWLKEIHGVCPLCRCNVCEAVTPASTSNTEISS
ncbi:hypothetical protein NMG60_11029260 [Bertholletia excelsa]